MTKSMYAVHSLYGEDMRALLERQDKFLAQVDASDWTDFEDDELSDDRPYQVVNGTALYSIRGKMLHTSNLFTRIFGIATYEDIGNALAMMAQDDEVERVLISMSTPGGMVAGISDLSATWRRLNAVKPIIVHTPAMLASAGIWLAVNSNSIKASETAEAGSIGVIQQHVSYEKYLEKEGIKVTEIKSAPLKAVGSPTKDLSQEEKEHLEKKVIEVSGLFRKQVYSTRALIQEEAFTGEMFIASEASRIGLIDGVSTYDEVFSAAMVAADDSNTHGGYDMKRKAVTATMYSAAVESGADPDSMKIVSEDEYQALQDGGNKEVKEVTQEEYDKLVESGADPETLKIIEEEDTSADSELSERVSALEEELDTSKAAIEALTDENTSLKAQLEAMDSDPLRKIALERIATMRVAFGLQPLDMSEFTTASLVSEYTALDKQFKKNFKAGGFVKGDKSSEEDDSTKTSAQVIGLDEARLRAVGMSN